jgi:hypothetical protein
MATTNQQAGELPVGRVSLTRRQLHELVWSMPMGRICARNSIKDVSLTNVCGQHDIPVPPKGYWAKRSRRFKKQKPPALPCEGETGNEVVVRAAPAPPGRGPYKGQWQPKEPDLLAGWRLFLANHDRMVVPVVSLPPIVETTRDALEDAIDRGGSSFLGHVLPRLPPDGRAWLDVNVSEQSIYRATELLGCLVWALEACGFQFTAPLDVVRLATIEGYGVTWKLKLDEIVREVKTVRPREITLGGDRSIITMEEVFQQVPTGQLRIAVRTRRGTGSNWRDKADGPLEDKLPQIVSLLFFKVQAERNEGRPRYIGRAKSAESDERIRAGAIERAATMDCFWRRVLAENERMSRLRRDLELWCQAEGVRAYARARQSACPDDEWAAWANAVADGLDPLKPDSSLSADERDAIGKRPLTPTIPWADV